MGRLVAQAAPGEGVPLMMQPRSRANNPIHSGVIDCATLYLCRQGSQWVVVMESPRVSGAVPLRYDGRNTDDARFELLTRARRACPDAAIMSTDGALTSADYEWRMEVRGVEARLGDLGVALHRELSTDPVSAPSLTLGRRCHWGLSPLSSGRPRTF
jgi:hypothetical protein